MTGSEHAWMDEPDLEVVASTEAKNLFGSLIDDAIAGKTVVITRRGARKAVLLGIEEFEALTRGTAEGLESLRAAFDERLAAMQSAASQAAVKAAFDASPKQLARAAVKAARRRA